LGPTLNYRPSIYKLLISRTWWIDFGYWWTELAMFQKFQSFMNTGVIDLTKNRIGNWAISVLSGQNFIVSFISRVLSSVSYEVQNLSDSQFPLSSNPNKG